MIRRSGDVLEMDLAAAQEILDNADDYPSQFVDEIREALEDEQEVEVEMTITFKAKLNALDQESADRKVRDLITEKDSRITSAILQLLGGDDDIALDEVNIESTNLDD